MARKDAVRKDAAKKTKPDRKAKLLSVPGRIARAIRALLGFMLRTLATAVLVVAFLSLATQIYLQRFWRPEEMGNEVTPPRSAVALLQTAAHIERIEAAIEVFRLSQGRYPLSLDDVVGQRLLGEDDLRFPGYQQTYYYEPVGETYELYPPKF